jgi:AmmeMemoRadiSam system protein B
LELDMSVITDVRPSPIAGQWYPGSPARLASSVDDYMAAAVLPEIEGEIVALVAPHAGHVYSGPVAGYAFAIVRAMQKDLVVVVSPMHQPHHKPLLTSAHQAYQTPLGQIPVDQEAVGRLDEHLHAELGFGLTPIRNDREHSLEIELPFLQQALASDFALLPVMVREQNRMVSKELGKAIARTVKARAALLVASTDLSHFYNQQMANALDGEILRQVEAFNPEGLFEAEEQGKGFACGRGALAAVMWAAKELGADKARVLNYATSGDVTGDHSQVVGYGAAVIYKSK